MSLCKIVYMLGANLGLLLNGNISVMQMESVIQIVINIQKKSADASSMEI